MKPKEIRLGSQIYLAENVLTDEVCDQLIEAFEKSPYKETNTVGDDEVKMDIRRGLELHMSVRPELKWADDIICEKVHSLIEFYLKNEIWEPRIFGDEGYTIQKTDPGEFYTWHADTEGVYCATRYLTCIFYLNEVEEGGETEFRRQKIKVRPKRGSMVCFPPYWTHEHRGCEVKAGSKYTIVTWVTVA